MPHPGTGTGRLAVLALVAIAIEFALTRAGARHGPRDTEPAYDLREAGATLGVVAGQVAIRLAEAPLVAGLFAWAWRHRLADPPHHGQAWVGSLVLLLLATDFLYYWQHRLSHRVRWFWANHAVHHSSTRLNLSAALRLGWTSFLSGNVLWFLPLAWIGFAPQYVLGAMAFDLSYQFFLHTALRPSQPHGPGPLRRAARGLFNTPSHHRVHHAIHPACLDRNFGGVLIVFDRMFGTFADAPAGTPLRFGLLDRPVSHRPLTIALGEWRRLILDVRRAAGWQERLRTLFGRP